MVLSIDRWVGKVAVVTGASSGIGAALAQRLARAGVKVVGLARRKDRLDDMAKNMGDIKSQLNLIAYKCDITKHDELLHAFRWITANIGPIHILVNNAGVHFRSSLINGNVEQWKQTLDTNVLALCVATKEAINIMKEHNVEGHIIHINSIAGHTTPTLCNLDIYGATKYAVTALTEQLRRELVTLGSRIKVTSVSPGVVDTEMLNNIREEQYFKDVLSKNMLQADDIVDGVMYVISTPPHVQVHELTIKAVGETI